MSCGEFLKVTESPADSIAGNTGASYWPLQRLDHFQYKKISKFLQDSLRFPKFSPRHSKGFKVLNGRGERI